MNRYSGKGHHQNKTSAAYRRGIKFLALRPRSIQEVEHHLLKNGFDIDTVAAVIKTLTDENLLNDKKFAEQFVNNREMFRPRSRFALRHELHRKGIPESTVQEVLKDIDEERSAFNALKMKWHLWHNLTEEKFKKKVFNFLSNRGFNRQVSMSAYLRLCEHIRTREDIQ